MKLKRLRNNKIQFLRTNNYNKRLRNKKFNFYMLILIIKIIKIQERRNNIQFY